MLPLCTVCRLVGLLISDIHCAWRCSVSVQVENLLWNTARSLRTRDLRNISYVAFLPSPFAGTKCFQSSGVFLGCQKFINNHFNQLSRRNKDRTQHYIIHLRALFYTTNSRAKLLKHLEGEHGAFQGDLRIPQSDQDTRHLMPLTP